MTSTTPHQAIYRRWRAQTFSEIVGQEAVVATLRNAVLTGQVAHAILFTGPRGTGKTSLARILAKALNCENLGSNGDPCDRCPPCVAIREGRALDLVEIDAASNRGIDSIRELRERLSYAPTDLRRKVYILDEAHQITRDAWNALLKSLEEPPEFVTFMFASTHPQEFPPAILSRLQRFDVRRLTVGEITGKLGRILAAGAREADPAAVDLIARLAAGGMRDAESILDQLLGSTDARIEAATVRDLLGLADLELVEGFAQALATGDAVTGVALLDDLEERGRDVRVFLDQVVDLLRERLLASLDRALPPDPALATAARRLAGIDPARLGPGGLRLQLELVLLDTGPAVAPDLARLPQAAPAARSAGPGPGAPRPALSLPQTGGVAGPDARASRGGARGEPPTVPDATTPSEPPAAVSRVGPEPVRAAPPDGRPAGPDRPTTPPPPTATEHEATRANLSPRDQTPSNGPVGREEAPVDGGSPSDASLPAAHRPADTTDDLERLRSGWGEIVTYVSRNPAAKPLIAACRPIAVERNLVTLGFPEEQAFLRDVAERRKANLEEGIARFLGHPVGVRCVATNLDLLPPLPEDAEAEHILTEARRIFADDLAEVPDVT